MGQRQKRIEAVTWKIALTPASRASLAALKDRRVLQKIRERIDGLARDPERQGKALLGELSGLRSVRTVGQRYRILYRIQADRVLVVIVGIGLRKEGDKADVYQLAKKLLRLGLLGDD